jgi:hypothetical protein
VPEPRSGKNRLHLDLRSADRLAEVARLVALGPGEIAEHAVPGLVWTVLAGPEGSHDMRHARYDDNSNGPPGAWVSSHEERRLMPSEAARALGVATSTLARWRRAGLVTPPR